MRYLPMRIIDFAFGFCFGILFTLSVYIVISTQSASICADMYTVKECKRVWVPILKEPQNIIYNNEDGHV